MDELTRKVKDTEKEVRRIIGDGLRQLRRQNGLTLVQAAKIIGSSPENLARLEDGDKGLNSVRMVQHIVTLGGKVTITAKDGTTIELQAPAFTDDQITSRILQREESLRQAEANKE